MKNFLTKFFVVLGVIFFLLIGGGAYVYIADPFGIKPLIQVFKGNAVSSGDNVTVNTVTDKQDNVSGTAVPLNSAQEGALRSLGIDPAALPVITPAMEQCFYDTLGASRAEEIKAGAAPTPLDYFKARSCLQ